MGLLKVIDKIIRPEKYSRERSENKSILNYSQRGIPIYYEDGRIFKDENDIVTQIKKDKGIVKEKPP
jgi:hypothetical protein